MDDDELLAALGDELRHDPPDLDEQRVVALRNEAMSHRMEAEDSGDGPAPSRTWRRRTRFVAAAAAAAVVAIVGVAVLQAIDDGSGADVEYAGPIDGTAGEGTLTITKTDIGRVVELRTGDLEILPTGEYYEVWFVGPDDSPDSPNRISAGTFHPAPDGRSDVTFAAAVDPSKFPIVEVTSEPADGDPRSSGLVVLVAAIDP